MLPKYKLILLAVFTVWTSSRVIAQEASDLYLFQIHTAPDHSYTIHEAKFLSAFNPGGYTNQPSFTPSGELLVSVRKKGEHQNDIYQLSLSSKKIKRLTQTKANEYSPRISPDGQRMSVVLQIEGDTINQQVVEASLKGGGYKSLTPNFRNIGYYTWVGDEQLALYRIDGASNHLELFNLPGIRKRRFTSSVGRTLLSDKEGAVIYLDKSMSNSWFISKYFPETDVFHPVIVTPGLAVDFAIAPDDTYFMGVGSVLYCFNPAYHTNWQQMGDLSIHGISKITRLAVSPDGKQLVLVSTK